MDKFYIEGESKLSGEISVKGAKNAALKIIPAAILSDEMMTITNMPDIEDISRSLELFKFLGGRVEKDGKNFKLQFSEPKNNCLDKEISNKLRASIMFVAPMLARYKEVKFPHPGGCVIGKRPIDLFIDGFKALGAEVTFDDEYYTIKSNGLKGGDFYFSTTSVTGTESMIMAAVFAEGTTVLKNCAMEPEIVSLIDYLNAQGAKISGGGTPTIKINGVNKLNAGTYNVMPDRIESGTFAIMAACSKSSIKITDCKPEHIESLLKIFSKTGVKFKSGNDYIEILENSSFSPYSIKTHEYPGFPTDLSSPYVILMTQASGTSIVHETIHDRRLEFTDMLSQMGANIIKCDPHRIVINGPTKLYGRRLTSPDLRAGITMIIAGLIAEGTTIIDNIYQIDRGYENIDKRLAELGAKIKREN